MRDLDGGRTVRRNPSLPRVVAHDDLREEVGQGERVEAGLDKAQLVAMTGYDPEKVPCLSEEVGFDQVLTKPVDPEVLQNVLRHPRNPADSSRTDTPSK